MGSVGMGLAEVWGPVGTSGDGAGPQPTGSGLLGPAAAGGAGAVPAPVCVGSCIVNYVGCRRPLAFQIVSRYFHGCAWGYSFFLRVYVT